MSTPTVSAIIATRNRPDMLPDAIAGVVEQDYAGTIETIVVYDQAAPEPVPDVGRDDRPVRVVVNDRSPGLAGARNTGLLAATGEFVAFCDDDDYWLPTKISQQVETTRSDPSASLTSCGIRVEYADDAHERMLRSQTVTFRDLLRDRHTELHPSTFFMRRDAVLGGYGMVDEQVPGGFGEDYDFLLRASRAGHVTVVPEVLTVVRWHQSSYFFRRWETMVEGLSWLLTTHSEFDDVPAGSARIRGQIAFALAAQRNGREAMRWAVSALRRNPLEPRTMLAAVVASRLVSPDRVMALLHARGKGI